MRISISKEQIDNILDKAELQGSASETIHTLKKVDSDVIVDLFLVAQVREVQNHAG